jgi:hypothetical protein
MELDVYVTFAGTSAAQLGGVLDVLFSVKRGGRVVSQSASNLQGINCPDSRD